MNQRLTAHQTEVFDRLDRIYRRVGGWIPESYIGSRGALAKLAEKGYVRVLVEYGPRGGAHRSYCPR
jgi:hypothetical protein